MPKYYDDTTLTYQQLVLKQIQKIQDISAKELRDSSKIVKNLIGEQTIEAEDTRYSYLQSIDLFGSLLFPYFPAKSKDKKNPNVHNEFDEFCELYELELINALNDEDYKQELADFFGYQEKELKEKLNSDDELKGQANIHLLNIKIKVARNLFRSLVKLFKDQDFLASENYGDSGNGISDNGMDAKELEEESEEIEEDGEIE